MLWAGVAGFRGVALQVKEASLGVALGVRSLDEFEAAIADTSLPRVSGLKTILDELGGSSESGAFVELMGEGVDAPDGGEQFAHAPESGAGLLCGSPRTGFFHRFGLKGQRKGRRLVGVGTFGVKESRGIGRAREKLGSVVLKNPFRPWAGRESGGTSRSPRRVGMRSSNEKSPGSVRGSIWGPTRIKGMRTTASCTVAPCS